MPRLILVIFLLTAFSFSGRDDCNCLPAKKTQKTCWGWVYGTFLRDGGTVKRVIGRVADETGESVGNTLIEVFKHPERKIEDRERVAACWTNKKGEFCFKDLKPGKYELRGSCRTGFDSGSTVITLDPKDKKAKDSEILVTLSVSQ